MRITVHYMNYFCEMEAQYEEKAWRGSLIVQNVLDICTYIS